MAVQEETTQLGYAVEKDINKSSFKLGVAPAQRILAQQQYHVVKGASLFDGILHPEQLIN